MRRPRLIVVGPLPPPYHGVTVSTSLVLANSELRRRFDVDHVDTSDHRTGGNIGSWDIANVRLALAAVARLAGKLRGEPGVVYLPLSQSTPGVLRDTLFIRAASMRGWKVAVHLRGSEFHDYYLSCEAPLRRWIRSTLARIDSVAVMGESLRATFDDLVPPEKIAVVRNGTPEPAHNRTPRDPDHVVFLSNLRRRKGVVEAVDAALLVVQARPSARFSFVGAWEDPDLERKLRAKVAGFDREITFRNPVHGAEKDQLLGSAAVLLFPPTKPEGHPRVVLEALAAGVPVVSTDRGAIAETVRDGVDGFVVSDPVPERLADRVSTLLHERNLQEQMAKAARERYLAHFTQARADRCLADWLEAVASMPPAAAR